MSLAPATVSFSWTYDDLVGGSIVRITGDEADDSNVSLLPLPFSPDQAIFIRARPRPFVALVHHSTGVLCRNDFGQQKDGISYMEVEIRNFSLSGCGRYLCVMLASGAYFDPEDDCSREMDRCLHILDVQNGMKTLSQQDQLIVSSSSSSKCDSPIRWMFSNKWQKIAFSPISQGGLAGFMFDSAAFSSEAKAGKPSALFAGLVPVHLCDGDKGEGQKAIRLCANEEFLHGEEAGGEGDPFMSEKNTVPPAALVPSKTGLCVTTPLFDPSGGIVCFSPSLYTEDLKLLSTETLQDIAVAGADGRPPFTTSKNCSLRDATVHKHVHSAFSRDARLFVTGVSTDMFWDIRDDDDDEDEDEEEYSRFGFKRGEWQLSVFDISALSMCLTEDVQPDLVCEILVSPAATVDCVSFYGSQQYVSALVDSRYWCCWSCQLGGKLMCKIDLRFGDRKLVQSVVAVPGQPNRLFVANLQRRDRTGTMSLEKYATVCDVVAVSDF